MRVGLSGPQEVNGSVTLPGSKAYTHRALIAGLLSTGETVLRRPSNCLDIDRTAEAVRTLGASVTGNASKYLINGSRRLEPVGPLNCRESGATLRFLAAVSSGSNKEITLITDVDLAKRPFDPLARALSMLGAKVKVQDYRVIIHGPIRGGRAKVTGEVSSQFVSALLLAAPLAEGNVTISIEGRMESKPYVDMTLKVLQKHRIAVEVLPGGFRIPAPQEYHPTEHNVPRDFSCASFLMTSVATAGGRACFSGLDPQNDLEPDYLILNVLEKIGVEVRDMGDEIIVTNEKGLDNFDFDARDNPDLVPALEVLACYGDGLSRITGVRRLRYKESDRLMTVPEELGKMGARIKIEDDQVKIDGVVALNGSLVHSHNDHRVVMACVAAAIGAQDRTTIEGSESVCKSYPGFFTDLSSLGVKLDVE